MVRSRNVEKSKRFEIMIWEDFLLRELQVIIYDNASSEKSGKRCTYNPLTGQIDSHDESEAPEPLIKLPLSIGREMIKALIHEFDRHGYLEYSEPKEVKVMSNHLEDMRRLVFKEKYAKINS